MQRERDREGEGEGEGGQRQTRNKKNLASDVGSFTYLPTHLGRYVVRRRVTCNKASRNFRLEQEKIESIFSVQFSWAVAVKSFRAAASSFFKVLRILQKFSGGRFNQFSTQQTKLCLKIFIHGSTANEYHHLLTKLTYALG